MAKIVLTDIANLQNEATAVAAFEANNTALELAIENTLSRDGTTPNTMGANLDMNSNRIVNLPYPINATEPFRFGDIDDIAPSVFVQNSAPDTTYVSGSLWIDADSSDLDLYQLTGGAWTDTTVNMKGSTGATGATGDTGAAGTNGTNGADGVNAGVKWNFDSSTAMADPGAGDIRLNNATLSSVTAIAISDNSAETGNPDHSTFVLSWDDIVNATARGILILKKRTATQNFVIFRITGASTDNVGWTQLAVTYVTHAGSFSNTDSLTVEFVPAGQDGAGTLTGSTGASDNRLLRADGVGGATVQSSAITVDDSGNMSGVGTISSGTITTTGTIELGNASDTTLSRSSAGVLAVEGVTVSLNSTSATHTAGTIELGAASDTTLSRDSAGVMAVEGVAIFSNIPQNSQSAAYTAVLGDAQKHILHPSSDNNARTFTIPANASVAYPIGTTITFINMINTVTIAITTDTLTMMGSGSTGSRTLAANGIAVAIKIASTSWIISGTGLT